MTSAPEAYFYAVCQFGYLVLHLALGRLAWEEGWPVMGVSHGIMIVVHTLAICVFVLLGLSL